MNVNIKEVLAFAPPPSLISRFSRDHATSEAEALDRFEEIKKFLVLAASNPARTYSPSKAVDEMWHSFLLNTKDYLVFCGRVGLFMHHIPSEELQPANYARTRRDMRRFFGELNSKYWSEHGADCSSCDCCPFTDT